jgi:hypothetical protein
MMHFPRLNLHGIKVAKKAKPEPPPKAPRAPKIVPEKKTVKGRKTKLKRLIRMAKVKWKYLLVCVFCIVVVISMYVIQHKQHMLRKIQKVPCRNINGIFVCKSTYSTGTMMLSTTPACKKYIYDIDGTPFINIPTWGDNTVSVGAHKTMRIRDAKPSCKLAMHRLTTPYKPTKIEGVVWITTKKHTQFSMTIKDTSILDQTPSDFIDSQENGGWIAYSFDPQMTDIRDVKITGDASDIIHVYTDPG